MSHSDDETMGEEMEMDLTNATAVERYRMASDIAKRAMAKIVGECAAGKKIVDLCRASDDFINAEVAKVLTDTKEKVEKGVAFPTCVSANNCAGHFCPLSADKTVLAAGDVAKIDLGVQIDGFIAVGAYTLVVSPSASVEGPVADVIAAAHTALNAAVGMLRPGKTNAEVSEVIRRVAEAYKVKAVEGVLSHQMKRFVIDGTKVVMNCPAQDQRVEPCEVEPNEVWSIDVVMSTGEGKTRELDTRTTIFKRVVDTQYLLKMKASKYVLREVNKRFPTFPFTLRALDEKQGRLGITEMLQHGMVDPYPVLYERTGTIVAQFKTTVLVFPDHNEVLLGAPLPGYVHSAVSVDDALVRAAVDASSKGASSAAAPASAPAPAAPAAEPMQM